jgi:transcription termination factor NusB
LKNAKRAKCRQNARNCAHNRLYQWNLNNAFAAAEDREYHTLIGTIAEAVLLVQQLPPNLQIQRLQNLTQRMLVQLDGQNPISSTRNTLSRSA